MGYVDIRLVKITSLDTGWTVKIDSLIKIATKIKNCDKYNELFILKIAKEIYGYKNSNKSEEKEKAIIRVKNFINVVNSINKKAYKYLYFNINNINGFWEYDLPTKHSVLPRVFKKHDGLYLDDGRHRVAALAAKGVEITPVVLVKPISNGTREEDLNVMKKLGLELKQKLKDFWETEEWFNYMETPDFIKSVGGSGNLPRGKPRGF